MSIEQRETDGVTQIPLKGVVGSDGVVRPSPASHPALKAADQDAASQGPGPVLPEHRPVPDIISQILIDGFPHPDPRYRTEQIQWAREVLWGKTATPYRTLVACRVMIDLSSRADERMVAARIQKDVAMKLRFDEAMKGPHWHLHAWAVGGIGALLLLVIAVLLVKVVSLQ